MRTRTASFPLQTFRDAAIREKTRRDPESAKYLQRSDFSMKKTGFAIDPSKLETKREAERPIGPKRSIRSIVEAKPA